MANTNIINTMYNFKEENTMTNDIITLNAESSLISENLFSACFDSSPYILLVPNSLGFAGSLFEIKKGETDIRLRLLDQSSDMEENQLSFEETISFIANKDSFERLMDAYDGDDFLSTLIRVLENCPYDCELDTLIDCVIGICTSYIYSVDFILRTLLSADSTSIGRLLEQEIEFSSII